MLELSPNLRRKALQVLSRDALAALTSALDLTVADRRSGEAHIDALLRSSVPFRTMLQSVKREGLKAMCEALGLDTSGREREPIIERIVAAVGTNGATHREQPTAGASDRGDFTLTPTAMKAKKTRGPAAPRSPRGEPTGDYRHDATRKNNPPAGLIDLDKPPPQKAKAYGYDPHLDPQLQWSGKAEHISFEVDTVSLHIHERVSAQAIMRAVKREDTQRSLFGGDDLPESKAIDFYAHEVGWANRLVLGDSLLVMNSLLEREQMAGKVQCIYVDPPYGVKFNSNFQPSISRRDVKEDDGSLTREPEQIQAYRDTWTLGIHSYLTYLRDRLLLARDLLHETGSLFVQISDENLHHVREVLDEIFGAENFVAVIPFRKKTMPLGTNFIEQMSDFIVWYARRKFDGTNRPFAKFHRLYRNMDYSNDPLFSWCDLPDGRRMRRTEAEKLNGQLPEGARVYRLKSLEPSGPMESGMFKFEFEGQTFDHPRNGYATTREGMDRLAKAGRLQPAGRYLNYVLFADDKPFGDLTAPWHDTAGADEKAYVVQTNTEVVKRCILMTTDPGDLVLDPTCGSGTTAVVAEHWGRRWIVCDTSRVALSIARQRLLTARYSYYRLRSERVRDGFQYQTAPHITLSSIAQNSRLDVCESRQDCDRLLANQGTTEVLYDDPVIDATRARVSGPFTVEAIPVASMEDTSESPIPQLEPEDRQDDIARHGCDTAGIDAGTDYVAYMIDLLKKSGGVHFKNGKTLPLTDLRPVKTSFEWLHAESATGFEGDDPRRVAVSFGPRHAPVTPKQVFDSIRETRGYDIVLFVGFACDPEALAMIEKGTADRIFQFVHAAPDILVGDLVKTTKTTKLFTVFGLPDVRVKKEKDGQVTVTLTGVDIYDPTTGETHHDDGQNVAAWFLDHDYDGRTFCVCQAFFPNGKAKNPWEKLQKALRGSIDEDKFEALRGTTSIPFTPGKKIAVKVIDDRGNEVVKVAGA